MSCGTSANSATGCSLCIVVSIGAQSKKPTLSIIAHRVLIDVRFGFDRGHIKKFALVGQAKFFEDDSNLPWIGPLQGG